MADSYWVINAPLCSTASRAAPRAVANPHPSHPLQGNWTYVAGVGCDPREDRYFLIPKQSRMYDDEGDYMRHWLPELAARGAPTVCLHDPWRLRPEHRGAEYPAPVVQLLAQRQSRGGGSAGYSPSERASAGAAAGSDVDGKGRAVPLGGAPTKAGSRAAHSGGGSRQAGGGAASSLSTHAAASGGRGSAAPAAYPTPAAAAHSTSGVVTGGDSAARTPALAACGGCSGSAVSEARGAGAGAAPPSWPGRGGGRSRRVQHLTA